MVGNGWTTTSATKAGIGWKLVQGRMTEQQEGWRMKHVDQDEESATTKVVWKVHKVDLLA